MSDRLSTLEDNATQAQRASEAALQRVPRRTGTPSRSAKWQRWMRWVHVYTSMIALAAILFFGVTGILLNHPTWLFGDELTITTVDGTLPASVQVSDDPAEGVEFLAVSEYLRAEHQIGGVVTNFDQIGDEGSINYTGPGYGATARFDITSLDYELTTREEGVVNAMRDLHSGSDTGSVWSLVIDGTSVFLVVVAISGLGIQIFLKKRRRKALTWMAGASAATAVLIWLTMV